MSAVPGPRRRAGEYAETHGLDLEIRGLVLLLFALGLGWFALTHGSGADRYLFGALAVAIGTFGLAYSDVGRRWQRGAAGERRVARRLEPLARRGWFVGHEIEKPTGGNIDHVVVGPGVVFSIETKLNRFGGRELGQARSHARFLERALGQPVIPVLCVANRRSKAKIYAGVWCVGAAGIRSLLEDASGSGPVDHALVARLAELG